jgi:hypothetical protein
VRRAPHRIFLLSPAHTAGVRARLSFDERARFDLARRLRSPEGAALGEVYSFLSGLYFRAKLLYARAFAAPPRGACGVLVITPGEGLRTPGDRVDLARLRRFAEVPIDASDPRYREPLVRDARALGWLVDRSGAGCEVILLGSIATGKYAEPLGAVFGELLRFPAAFVGRGDMSRGGLMLRALDAGRALETIPLAGAVRHGPRPPRLQPRGTGPASRRVRR